MPTFRVIATILSRSGVDAPADIPWYTGTSHVRALAAMVQAATDLSDQHYDLPGRYDLVSVRLLVENGAAS